MDIKNYFALKKYNRLKKENKQIKCDLEMYEIAIANEKADIAASGATSRSIERMTKWENKAKSLRNKYNSNTILMNGLAKTYSLK